nr:MAG TPA: hypothetical protein [Caudoviricetes sp.]
MKPPPALRTRTTAPPEFVCQNTLQPVSARFHATSTLPREARSIVASSASEAAPKDTCS